MKTEYKIKFTDVTPDQVLDGIRADRKSVV